MQDALHDHLLREIFHYTRCSLDFGCIEDRRFEQNTSNRLLRILSLLQKRSFLQCTATRCIQIKESVIFMSRFQKCRKCKNFEFLSEWVLERNNLSIKV